MNDCAVLTALWPVLSGSKAAPPFPLDCCNRPGVTCVDNRITAIVFDHNNLKGTIPPQIAQLTELTSIQLSDNAIKGAMPTELGRLGKLTTLNLGHNDLTGSIPASLGNTRLQLLYLDNNDLSGPIPQELGGLKDLSVFYLSHNAKITGSIPQSFAGLTAIVDFQADSTGLTGPVPSEWAALNMKGCKTPTRVCRRKEAPFAPINACSQLVVCSNLPPTPTQSGLGTKTTRTPVTDPVAPVDSASTVKTSDTQQSSSLPYILGFSLGIAVLFAVGAALYLYKKKRDERFDQAVIDLAPMQKRVSKMPKFVDFQ